VSIYTFETCFGPGIILWSDFGLKALKLGEKPSKGYFMSEDVPEFVRQASSCVARHLIGDLQDFSSFPVDLRDIPIFARLVLDIVRQIPLGRHMTYKEIAERAGCPMGQRAVGLALKKNPLPIIIPCHRVVATHGIGGYSGYGGIEFKRYILSLEGVNL